MDLIILVGIATALLIILLSIYLFQKGTKEPKDTQVLPNRPVPVRAQEGIPRRAQIARNQRNRLRNVQQQNEVVEDDEDDNSTNETAENFSVTDEKMGAKKKAKLEAKAEKRAQREAEVQAREEKKKKEAVADEERKKLEEKEAEAERKKEELERLAREEQERKELEEYLKMKAEFNIEEEGFDENNEEENNLLQEFIDYIKQNKVIVLEDLATHFKLKTQQVIDRISELQRNNTLTGVIDDRGKFIYIPQNELEAVAKFIRQRGRISITELAESSNNLINLTPISS